MSKLRILCGLLSLFVLATPTLAHAQNVYYNDSLGKVVQATLPTKTILLTFDDGPSKYTPQILSILEQKQVNATFFVIGNQAVKFPILQRIYDEGNDIGNHTYSHPDLTKLAIWHMRLELNMTRIIISSQINHSTRLFRPPFLGSDALVPAQKDVINRAVSLGYLAIGESIDAEDWRRPGTEQIVNNATTNDGGIILLHDGGGDRSQTVKALPAIIDYYKSRGYTFTTVSGALGIARSAVMPALTRTERIVALLASIILTISAWLGSCLRWLIIIMICASFARFFLVTAAAIIQSRRKPKRYPNVDLPACTILMPAYNEAAVIQSCLKSVLASDYPRFEVLVIDDGSKDATYELASQVNDPRLRVLKKENGGKASALNFGIAASQAPIIIAIDADTVFRHNTVANLMSHFANPKVGAVSGNTKIVNRHTLITKLQSLEYIVGFNLDRRMGDLLDCITVVPGAVGAFRRTLLDKVGGFTFDTLAEDTDLTLAIKETGAKIVYDSAAIALTEAPSTIRDLMKQRFRWTFGTMQAVWKHKGSFLNPKKGSLGLIGLPYLLFFQIIFPLFAPLFDLALLIGLINHQYKLMLLSFVVYTFTDIITAAIALRLDNEKLSSLWILIPQRIFYRQLMYYVIIRSTIYVLRGRLVHWGKLERTGTDLAKNV